MFHKDVRAALVATAAVALSLVSVYARQQSPHHQVRASRQPPQEPQPPATPAARGARGGGAGRGGQRGAAPRDPADHTGFEQISTA